MAHSPPGVPNGNGDIPIVSFGYPVNLKISGNIYIGRIERVLETLGGAFVNIGTSKNAFLKLRDLTPSYIENVLSGKKVASGLKILVQVKKDGTKQKGPQVTTKICLAGRFLVFYPLICISYQCQWLKVLYAPPF